MKTKCSVIEENVLVFYRGHQLFTSLKLNMSKCFRISGVAVSVWCCYCNLEMALRQMSLGMDQWHPQHSHSSRGFSQGTRVGRQICQSVASGVCFLQPRLLKCMLSFFFKFYFIFFLFFFRSTHVAATKLIAREMRDQRGTITKRF